VKSFFGLFTGGAATMEEELRTEELDAPPELDLDEDDLDEDERTVELADELPSSCRLSPDEDEISGEPAGGAEEEDKFD